MKSFVIGQYIPGDSFLYKMDPRSKLYALFLLMITSFFLPSIYFMFGMFVFVILFLKIGGINLGRVIKGLKPILILLLFTFGFQIAFIKTGTPLIKETMSFNVLSIAAATLIFFFWIYTKRYVRYKFIYLIVTIFAIISTFIYVSGGYQLGTTGFIVYSDGLLNAAYIMLRLIIIITLSTMLTLTTKPTDLNLGLESMLRPLKVIKVNSEEMAMIISIALRYIPTLLDEANKIMLAQASRGVDFTEGKMKDKVMQIISLLVPMFIISFKRSDDLADAMEARNFVPGNPRTRLHVLSWHTIDSFTIALSISILIASIAVRYFI